jgi:hypothetical protein
MDVRIEARGSLLHVLAAVDVPHRTGDERRTVGGEEMND